MNKPSTSFSEKETILQSHEAAEDITFQNNSEIQGSSKIEPNLNLDSVVRNFVNFTAETDNENQESKNVSVEKNEEEEVENQTNKTDENHENENQEDASIIENQHYSFFQFFDNHRIAHFVRDVERLIPNTELSQEVLVEYNNRFEYFMRRWDLNNNVETNHDAPVGYGEDVKPKDITEVTKKTNTQTKWAFNAWLRWARNRNIKYQQFHGVLSVPLDIEAASETQLDFWLCKFVWEAKQRNSTYYSTKALKQVLLGLQRYLCFHKGRQYKIFNLNNQRFLNFKRFYNIRVNVSNFLENSREKMERFNELCNNLQFT